MTALRVLLLFSSSELGGAERSLTRMALASSGIEYHLATLDGEGEWCEWLRGIGHPPAVFGERPAFDQHGAISWRALSALRRYVKRERIDVIYVCGVRAAFALRWLKHLMSGARIVHGVRWNPGSRSRLDVGFRLIERWSNRLVNGYITNSRIAAATLIDGCSIPARRVHVIYNGIAEMPAMVPSLSSRPLEVLTVANLSARKGHREYLAAVHLVLEAVPEARFIFVGRDDMNGEIQRAVAAGGLSHAVSCVGFQPDVSEYFRRARMFVLPSLWNEGAPTAVLESFAWQCPVVAYGIDGIPELIDHAHDGFIIPPRDTLQLASHIIRLLTDVNLASELGLAGKKKVAERFTLAQTAQAHERTLMQIANDST